ncbi:MAG: hypothetical protein IJP92_02700 [Lachnospiraceae bacterium]|nr:hypothetical protein [Lachnospiraceae bacterium]
MKRFIDCYNEDHEIKYDAGIVYWYEGDFIIGYEQKGAADTFSIGQPVYDEDQNLMGYLGVTVFRNLDYSTESGIRIPVEVWRICLPTKHCVEGKKVYTYWQNKSVKEGKQWKGD